MIIKDLDLKRAAEDPAYLAHLMTLFSPRDWILVSAAIEEFRARACRSDSTIDKAPRRFR